MLDFSHTSISFKRSLWSYHKIQAVRGALIRNRPAFVNIKEPGLILDIGCGPNTREHNINLDYDWRPGIDICWNITNGLPLPDDYVRGIFTEHCLEHISFEETRTVLRECLTIMQKGACLRIVVPDFAIYAKAYQEKQPMLYAEEDSRDGIYSPVMSINRIMRAHGHKFYDFSTLAAKSSTRDIFVR